MEGGRKECRASGEGCQNGDEERRYWALGVRRGMDMRCKGEGVCMREGEMREMRVGWRECKGKGVCVKGKGQRRCQASRLRRVPSKRRRDELV